MSPVNKASFLILIFPSGSDIRGNQGARCRAVVTLTAGCRSFRLWFFHLLLLIKAAVLHPSARRRSADVKVGTIIPKTRAGAWPCRRRILILLQSPHIMFIRFLTREIKKTTRLRSICAIFISREGRAHQGDVSGRDLLKMKRPSAAVASGSSLSSKVCPTAFRVI